MEIELHYGKSTITLTLPDRNVGKIIRPWHSDTGSNNESHVRFALKNRESTSFRQAVSGKRVCVLTEDATRDMPIGDILPVLAPLLSGAGSVGFIISTGTHSADTTGNRRITETIKRMSGSDGFNCDVHVHDCEKCDFSEAGKTRSGTSIQYNRLVDDAEVFLVLSDVKCHYFAGYSNPVKNFCPGICSYQTVEKNHSLALDENSRFGYHPWHPDLERRRNPVANDQLEGMKIIVRGRPVFSLVTISTSGDIQWAGFGKVEEITEQAIQVVDSNNIRDLPASDRLVVSPGGYPNDVSLYIAQRALEMTQAAVTDGGEILFLTACPDGPGEPQTMENFYNRLTAPLEEIFKSTESGYRLYSHKPYRLAKLVKRMSAIYMLSEMPDRLVSDAHMIPVHDPAKVIDGWIARDPGARINFVDGANKTAVKSR